jgi:hypothetical protein
MINHCMSEYDLQTVITNVHHAYGGILVEVRGSSASQLLPACEYRGKHLFFHGGYRHVSTLCRLVEQVSRLIRYALHSEKSGCKIPFILMNEN